MPIREYDATTPASRRIPSCLPDTAQSNAGVRILDIQGDRATVRPTPEPLNPMRQETGLLRLSPYPQIDQHSPRYVDAWRHRPIDTSTPINNQAISGRASNGYMTTFVKSMEAELSVTSRRLM